MSLERGYEWRFQDLQFVGYSLAGISTSIVFKNAKVCFDVAQGLPFQMGARHLLITHGHLDHAAGIAYFLSQRAMHGHQQTDVYIPRALYEPVEQTLKIWSAVEENKYPYTIHPTQPGEFHDLSKSFVVKPFQTVHRIPSQGYLIYARKRRLKSVYADLSEEEIIDLRRAKVDPTEEFFDPLVAFTGDTQIEFLDFDPDVRRSKVLFMEVTFWDEKKPVSEARRWGHIHFEEFLARKSELENERVVLIHTSTRFRIGQLQEILANALTEDERERIVLFPRP